jgi:hypothetical protein
MVVPSLRLRIYLTDPPNGELGWDLREDAPEDIQEEFKNFMDAIEAIHNM